MLLAQLAAHEWPGNVRELQNVIERSVILCNGGRLELPPLSTPRRGRGSRAAGPAPARTMREMEETLIREALQACGGVVGGKKGAARRLDMPASTLRERIQRYGLQG